MNNRELLLYMDLRKELSVVQQTIDSLVELGNHFSSNETSSRVLFDYLDQKVAAGRAVLALDLSDAACLRIIDTILKDKKAKRRAILNRIRELVPSSVEVGENPILSLHSAPAE